jgi:hypothetical protein
MFQWFQAIWQSKYNEIGQFYASREHRTPINRELALNAERRTSNWPPSAGYSSFGIRSSMSSAGSRFIGVRRFLFHPLNLYSLLAFHWL